VSITENKLPTSCALRGRGLISYGGLFLGPQGVDKKTSALLLCPTEKSARPIESHAATQEDYMSFNQSGRIDPDIYENDLRRLSHELVARLLHDHTTGHNIRWCTHDYEHFGDGYGYNDEITTDRITGVRGDIIKPRVLKTKAQQSDRVKGMAEVFTPSWVVKMMVDYVDIDIDNRCLELTCGEAPFLVSRYDATSGITYTTYNRIGILDRKLHLVNEQKLSDDDWLARVRKAFQNTYGYEWLGDSLLLARENLLYTFVDFYENRFGSAPDIELMLEFADIVSWNLWQMDGLTYQIPQEKKEQPQPQTSILDDAPVMALAPLCRIKDWQNGNEIKVIDIKNKNLNIMKFDVIIGNPPYQEEVTGDNKFTPPVYNYFIEESQKIGSVVELIHPARFLFNAGSTPKEWNNKMLNDEHLKILLYEQDSSILFGNSIDIKGGIVVSYRDSNKVFGAIKTFTSSPEQNSILHKVWKNEESTTSITSIIYIQNRFNLETLFNDYPNVKDSIGSDGKDSRLEKNIFVKVPIFTVERQHEDDIKVLGILENNRVWRYIPIKYIDTNHENLKNYKVMIPVATGRGVLGETLSTPVIGHPMVAFTRSFIGIGAFNNLLESENCLKYVKTKFCRVMLGVLKITQMNNKDVWQYVPLQDFTSNSDIDWSKSIAEIDEQLFEKYELDEQERNFIRTKIKEMK